MTQSVRVLGSLDPGFAWDGDLTRDLSEFDPGSGMPAGLRGSFASVRPGSNGSWRLSRDPLGINKLFWAREPDGNILTAALPHLLVQAGRPFETVRSIPAGSVLDLHPGGVTKETSLIPSSWFSSEDGADGADVEQVAAAIRDKLDRYLAALAKAHPRARAFVCLSGGLDSTGVATLVRKHFRDTVAVSFDLQRTDGPPSEDRQTARRLAKGLGIPLLEANATEDHMLDMLDTVLLSGADWRDFNVHAALVNAVIAQNIRQIEPSSEALVFTGDLANEFLADYESEQYRGKTYYRLPRLSPAALRDSLVRGLDTSHREIGVFGAWGLPVIQPYAVAVDEYMKLGDEFLGSEGRKQLLCSKIFGGLIPDYISSRTKVRAQMGDESGGGILAICVDRGIDNAWLRRRFAELHGVENPADLDRFMRAGRYFAARPTLEDILSKETRSKETRSENIFSKQGA